MMDVPDDKKIDMDAVVSALHDRGHFAYVEQTGGGCATIYAGARWLDDEGYRRYEALAGPGWFEGPGWTMGRALAGDFYIGPEDDLPWLAYEPPAFSETDPEVLADEVVKIIEMVRKARAQLQGPQGEPVDPREHLDGEQGHLNVAELRDLLEGLPGGIPVVLDDSSWYVYPDVRTPRISQNGEVDPDAEGISCVTLYQTSAEYDPRDQ